VIRLHPERRGHAPLGSSAAGVRLSALHALPPAAVRVHGSPHGFVETATLQNLSKFKNSIMPIRLLAKSVQQHYRWRIITESYRNPWWCPATLASNRIGMNSIVATPICNVIFKGFTTSKTRIANKIKGPHGFTAQIPQNTPRRVERVSVAPFTEEIRRLAGARLKPAFDWPARDFSWPARGLYGQNSGGGRWLDRSE